ncbi:MAG: alpha/beta hydrolase [Chloroflexi bacterium]|nr:alpha/beta hydrolase [Chloroflexota bacterium]
MSQIEKTVFYKVDGQALHVHEDGPEDGQIVLVVHGWSSSWYALSPLFKDLRNRFRLLAVDLPGYGESPRFEERTTIAAYADFLAKFVRQLSDQPIVYIGHSMGGMIGMTMALRHPDLIERMVALCPTVSGNLSSFINAFVSPITLLERFGPLNWLVSLLEPHVIGLTDRLMRPASFADRTQIPEEEYKRLRYDARRPGQGRVRAECYWAMRNNDLRGQISKIDVPTLILWGMEDNTVPLRDASAVALEWPDADLRVIPNAGHWPQFEAAETTRRYVKAFLGTPAKLFKFYDLD